MQGICLPALKNRRKARQQDEEEEDQRTFIPCAASQDCLLLAPGLPRAGKGISDATLRHVTQSRNFQVNELSRDGLSRNCSELPCKFSTRFSLQVGVEGCSFLPAPAAQLARALSYRLTTNSGLQLHLFSLWCDFKYRCFCHYGQFISFPYFVICVE